MRAMVKTYGQMPLQLFKEPHYPRTKTAVLTTFRMRLGNVLKRWTTTSPLMKVTTPYIWMSISVHRARFSTSSSDCDFIGAQGKPELLLSHVVQAERTPENMVFVASGELVLTDNNVLFYQNASLAHSSLLVQWGTWDNSLVVRSTTNDCVVKLHSHLLNMVCECGWILIHVVL